ncbi:MAG: NHL repeat-containing protein [Gemmataceae bacterium]|nr:NHL repeat-containing protein [Gemmata sp.]MDW8196965.1 NHL repeat-containing protein [Gemmataceae bacterium]
MKPALWLGAPAPGRLALPAAGPTASQLYAPRGVWLDAQRLIVADSGNHRVLIWHTGPTQDHQPADVVLGQPDFTTEGPKGLHLPTGVLVVDDQLLVCDAWHHRVLIWDRIPTSPNTPPAAVLGQPHQEATEPNRGGAISGCGFYWPYGIGWAKGWLWVADTGNRRVLGWQGIPSDGQAADIILGQPDATHGAENRGGPVAGDSFRWPHAVAATEELLFVADAGNHRVLGWLFPVSDRPADVVLGQPAFDTNHESPYAPPGPSTLRFPYGVTTWKNELSVADTANNRVVHWNTVPTTGAGHPANAVFGQETFASAGENRWQAVTADSLCWPYGVCRCGPRLAIADSGNNRVMIWQQEG